MAWREMMEHVVLEGRRDLLITLARQWDTEWGCRTPLGEERIGHVQELVDEVFERRR